MGGSPGIVQVSADESDLAKLDQALADFPQEIPRVLAGGINDATKKVATELSRVIRGVVNIKKRDLDGSIHVKRASASGPFEASVIMSQSRRLNLAYFGGRQVKAKNLKRAKGLSATARGGATGGLRFEIEPGHVSFLPGAFLVPKSSLKNHSDPNEEGDMAFVRKGRKRLPIKKRSGPSAWGVYIKHDLDSVMLPISAEELSAQIDRRLNYALLKLTGAI